MFIFTKEWGKRFYKIIYIVISSTYINFHAGKNFVYSFFLPHRSAKIIFKNTGFVKS